MASNGPGGGKRKVSARLVIGDPGDAQEMAGWRTTVESLHAQGGLALAQICDSHDVAALTDAAWDARVDALIKALPNVDAWEAATRSVGTGWAVGRWPRRSERPRPCVIAPVPRPC